MYYKDMNYDHKKIEAKWQERWEKEGLHAAQDGSKKEKFFGLIEFPYPSGEGLHVGHPRSYTAMDVIARKKRMQGLNVLYPIGFDAFGLPAENYAIKMGLNPAKSTADNVKNYTRQLKSIGYSFDWSRSFSTTDPEYCKWTQWIFVKMFESGLAYKAKMAINWCLSCKIGLANEEVVNGKCERCGGEVEQRDIEQWMLKITDYADRLIEDLDTVDYLEKIKTQQINWVGRSEGVNFKEKVKDLDIEFEVYDSIPQTFLAQTFTIIAPEHPMVEKLVKGTKHEKPVMEFVEKIKKKKMSGKFDIETDLEGIFTGRYVDNPFGTGDLPIWVASFVLVDYGTGVVNCSAHDERDFEFAKKYDLPLKVVMLPSDQKEAKKVEELEYCYHHAPKGIIQEPAEFKGKAWEEVREPVIDYIEKKKLGSRAVNYKLRDWIFSRQRYWGEPIPMIHCEKCGWVTVPEKDLPVLLPEVEKYEPTDTGESPLAKIEDWVNTTCPKCDGPGKRETDVMPNWAGSNWYYLRYCDSKNDKVLADPKKLEYWAPVDWYNGGMEHTTLHLLYSRFVYKFLWDIGAVPKKCGSEPYQKRTSHGMILGEGGVKMSKSKGNVINPDDVIAEYGADAFRTYEMFMGPFAEAIPWSTTSMVGVRRFLEKVYGLFSETGKQTNRQTGDGLERLLHKTIKKVTEDIESMKFNTAISQLMILVNEMTNPSALQSDQGRLEQGRKAASSGPSDEVKETLLKLLAPFAPHTAEELWEKIGHKESIFKKKWPEHDEALAKDDVVELVVQINGKVRDKMEVPVDISEDEAKEKVLASEKVQKWLEGKEPKKVIFVKGKLVSIVV